MESLRLDISAYANPGPCANASPGVWVVLTPARSATVLTWWSFWWSLAQPGGWERNSVRIALPYTT